MIFIHRLLPSSVVWFCFVTFFLREKVPDFMSFQTSCLFFLFNWERKRMVNLFQNLTIVLNSVESSVSIFNVDLSHLYIQSNPYNSVFEWYNSIFSFYRRRWTPKKHTQRDNHNHRIHNKRFEQEWWNRLFYRLEHI